MVSCDSGRSQSRQKFTVQLRLRLQAKRSTPTDSDSTVLMMTVKITYRSFSSSKLTQTKKKSRCDGMTIRLLRRYFEVVGPMHYGPAAAQNHFLISNLKQPNNIAVMRGNLTGRLRFCCYLFSFGFNPRPWTPIFITRTCVQGRGRCDPRSRFETKGRRA